MRRIDRPEGGLKRRAGRIRRLGSLAMLSLTACIPYSVGTTAQPTPIGERHTNVIASVLPTGGERFGDPTRGASGSYVSLDTEVRFGASEEADVGFRIPSMSGLVVNYKRRHRGFADEDSAGFATMLGGGLINGGFHGHLEGTLLWSGRRRGSSVPYGGARLMQAIPFNRLARHDDPTVGVFLGVMLGGRRFAVAPEIAVYYDRSVLGLRESPWMFIPAITLRDLPLPSRGPRMPPGPRGPDRPRYPPR
jgi:hypothetical protein